MSLKRNTDQKSKTLIQFYDEAKNSDNQFSSNLGELMINWIKEIDSEFKTTEIWGLTSHYHLILQNENDYTSPNYVVLIAGHDEYHLEYLIPESSQPWENAYVKGATKSLEEAMKMLKTAMRESRGWIDSNEL
ncbi:hypothetical protein [Kordia sp.]|uniref:hypothetical protein n=1 Tax=Kordia sp. TaxID=1965332 RepID=UPI0025B9698A|nr:hypothetical protein [Kordia sp.]MCH2195295.1 hypothetical protein [Kordia sp.]